MEKSSIEAKMDLILEESLYLQCITKELFTVIKSSGISVCARIFTSSKK